MMAKYFFNISELIENGQGIEDVIFAIEYDEQISMQQDPITYRGPFKWDDAGTYYFEFDWSGSKIYGDRELQISFRVKQDSNYMTHWDSSNDYSRKGLTSEFEVCKNVPVYLDGVKAYGEEPPKLSPTPTPTKDPDETPDINASISVSYKCGAKDDAKNTIRAAINIKNTGTTPVNLSDIKVRYWFTSDGNEQNTFVCDYAACGTENVKGTVKKIENPVPGADSYCEISFSEDAGKIAPGGSTGTIPFRIDGAADYDQTDDYSYDSNMSDDLGDNTKITAYIKDKLKYGVEPVTTIDILLGDLNYDGEVNSTDCTILKRYILRKIDIGSDPNFLTAADVNRDGSVDSTDLTLIKRYILRKIKSF
jgi:hypothetical protein